MKLKLTGIELTTTDGKKVALTLDEARDLHRQLAELFAYKETVVYRDPKWWEQPVRPYWYSHNIPAGGIAQCNNTDKMTLALGAASASC